MCVVPSLTERSFEADSVTDGATLFTCTWNVAEPDALSLSFTETVTV